VQGVSEVYYPEGQGCCGFVSHCDNKMRIFLIIY
jgi:hypothetical protein